MPLNRLLPQNSVRARTAATSMPSGRLRPTPHNETLRLSIRASYSLSESAHIVLASRRSPRRRLEARPDLSAMGRRLGSFRHLEPLLLEEPGCFRRAEPCQILNRLRLPRYRSDRDRIDDGRVAVIREDADDFDAGIGGDVALVDDAERHLAAADQ